MRVEEEMNLIARRYCFWLDDLLALVFNGSRHFLEV